ncbi:MAG TPA: hypothetical protein VLM79_30370 [Kofleriaceae bacterium]|nr:hypothetical protein [Kofleriaceae bacterium]
MGKAVVAFLMIASVMVARTAAGSPPSDPDGDDYFTARDIAQVQYYDDIFALGIDVTNETKPPNPECVLLCENVEEAARQICNLLGPIRTRLGCLAGVAGGGAVCRYVCTL